MSKPVRGNGLSERRVSGEDRGSYLATPDKFDSDRRGTE